MIEYINNCKWLSDQFGYICCCADSECCADFCMISNDSEMCIWKEDKNE